jgi:molybdopterin-containing oxidoreductase family iron-sulfur binding subunit
MSLVRDFKKILPSLRHASWEPGLGWADTSAQKALYGEAIMPRLHLDRAQVILALESDFLGSAADAPMLVSGFASRRRPAQPEDTVNRLWVVEGGMSLTGANADQRLQARPTQIAPLVFAIAHFMSALFGIPLPRDFELDSLKPFDLDSIGRRLRIEPSVLRALAQDLVRAGKSALVIAGPALPTEAHVAAHLVNSMLGAEGNTVDPSQALPSPELLSVGEIRDLLNEAKGGGFAAAIFWGPNPGHAFPDNRLWQAAAAGIPEKIRIGLYEDETASACSWRLPEHHWLESWGDLEPAADLLCLRQPAIAPLYDSKQGEDILLSWIRGLGGESAGNYHEYLKSRWKREVYPAGSPVPFSIFWNSALQDGVLPRASKARPVRTPRAEALKAAALGAAAAGNDGELELTLAPDAAIHDGRYANNGWLNELPNPVTKATWGNPILISISDAERLGIQDGDILRITAKNASLEVPAVVQPGQTPGVCSLTFGYGRQTGSIAAGVGVNAFALMDPASPSLVVPIRLARTGKRKIIPRTQDHDRMEGRDLIRSWTAVEYFKKAKAEKKRTSETSLIPGHPFSGHKWGMAVDLSACVGCSACVIACQSENNIAVVGPERIARGRGMHWIRIDRYYEGDPKDPSVVHQPVLCQHCDRAPCEIVCPVNATTHSADGLNQMSYNRCVGTRYCSNNCPYKVRRFNFFDYTSMKKAPENLVFNPEVTVRPRGVMEKCTFCIQRIEDGRIRAKSEGRALLDGEIRPACAVACPADAIVFGDLNDSKSAVSAADRSNRGYKLLAETGVKPSITYLADISNPAVGKRKA